MAHTTRYCLVWLIVCVNKEFLQGTYTWYNYNYNYLNIDLHDIIAYILVDYLAIM